MKAILSFVLAALLLVGCGAPAVSEAPSSAESAAPAEPLVLVKDDAFNFGINENQTYAMEYYSNAPYGLRLSILPGYDTSYLGDSGFYSLFNIIEVAAQKEYGAANVMTARNLKEVYKTEDPAELAEKMKADFFTAKNKYDGLKKNITEDFGYELTEDIYSSAYGLNGYYFEFKDTEKKTVSMRLYLCNDQINENFFAFSVNADVPEEDAVSIDNYRRMIFSLHPAQ